MAIADYTEAIRLAPNLAQAYYNRGVAYENIGDRAKADRISPSEKVRGQGEVGLSRPAGAFPHCRYAASYAGGNAHRWRLAVLAEVQL